MITDHLLQLFEELVRPVVDALHLAINVRDLTFQYLDTLLLAHLSLRLPFTQRLTVSLYQIDVLDSQLLNLLWALSRILLFLSIPQHLPILINQEV